MTTYKPTGRNHYNPCFWTALWNVAYYENWITGKPLPGRARDQTVLALNLRAEEILTTKVDRVHFDQGLGKAEITAESMKSFCKRRHPDKYAEFCKYVDEH